MLTYTLSIIIVSIICFCFYKKDFWENRYIVLLISAGVALIVTLVLNYSVRNSFDKKVVETRRSQLYTFYLPNDIALQRIIMMDSTKKPIDTLYKRLNIIKDWDYYHEKASDFYQNKKRKQIPTKTVLYTVKGNVYIGTFWTEEKQDSYELKNVYVAPSENDSTAYVVKKKLVYDVKPSKWINDMSLPRISTITVLYIPPKEYKMIPDSLIRKIPY